MTKPKSSSTPFETLLNGASALPDVGARTEAFWSAQAEAAEHVRKFVDGWWERRHDAAASAAECCAKLFSNGADPSASADAWSAWARETLERLSEDAKAQTALAGTLAADAVRALGAKADGSPSHGGKGGKSATARAGGSSEDVR